jgi:hypothetical protein
MNWESSSRAFPQDFSFFNCAFPRLPAREQGRGIAVESRCAQAKQIRLRSMRNVPFQNEGKPIENRTLAAVNAYDPPAVAGR